MSINKDSQKALLKSTFGYDDFRPGQQALIDAVLAGRDALGIMPTGAGKSLCYQIPALMMEGLTLVVSPLISLMVDQVSALRQAGVAAGYINSALTPGQAQVALRRAAQGAYRILYVAPERLETESFLAFAMAAGISMVTVDEAHCVSQWGQDFRPSYLRIAAFIDSLPERPVVSAYTATATPRVKADIIDGLRLNDPVSITTGFDRPGLHFMAFKPTGRDACLRALVLERALVSGIVYCATRKAVDSVYEMLIKAGLPATRYHAGMGEAARQQSQDDFQYDRASVMVATNAFGMGIDKSNVRYVIHYNMPRSLEAYYQEAGRAGRDGERADCILLYGGQDVILGRYLIEHSVPSPDLSLEQQAALKARELEKLKQMTFYATTKNCLRQFLLRYFGETLQAPCGDCSNCLGEMLNEAAYLEKKPARREKASDTPMFAALKKLRAQLAAAQHAPAYVVFSDATLRALDARRPRTRAEFLQVPGVGKVKCDRYADVFLTEIDRVSDLGC